MRLVACRASLIHCRTASAPSCTVAFGTRKVADSGRSRSDATLFACCCSSSIAWSRSPVMHAWRSCRSSRDAIVGFGDVMSFLYCWCATPYGQDLSRCVALHSIDQSLSWCNHHTATSMRRITGLSIAARWIAMNPRSPIPLLYNRSFDQ